jgi:hypothetical protein
MMMNTPDQWGDSAKLHAEELQHSMQRDQAVQRKQLTWVRLIVRRILGRQSPPK